jgi:hypothetical protein
MLIDYILESGSEMILLGVDYYPEELLPAVDTERSVFDDVVNPHPTLLSDILFLLCIGSMLHYMRHIKSVCLATIGINVAAYVLTISGLNVPSVRSDLV